MQNDWAEPLVSIRLALSLYQFSDFRNQRYQIRTKRQFAQSGMKSIMKNHPLKRAGDCRLVFFACVALHLRQSRLGKQIPNACPRKMHPIAYSPILNIIMTHARGINSKSSRQNSLVFLPISQDQLSALHVKQVIIHSPSLPNRVLISVHMNAAGIDRENMIRCLIFLIVKVSVINAKCLLCHVCAPFSFCFYYNSAKKSCQ